MAYRPGKMWLCHLQQLRNEKLIRQSSQNLEQQKDKVSQPKNSALQQNQQIQNQQVQVQQINSNQQSNNTKIKLDIKKNRPQKLNKIQTVIDQQVIKMRELAFVEYFQILWDSRDDPQSCSFHMNEICTICQFPLFDLEDDSIKRVQDISQQHVDKVYEQVVKLDCDHYYHLQCLEQCYKDQSLQCSICNRIYGIKLGEQPDGQMTVSVRKNMHCQGYEQYGTIIIEYNIKPGFKDKIQHYGTNRVCYLPDSKDGRDILQLLKTAFDRKLIFTVGRSVTTGQDNCVVWNGIHHKTNLKGGSSHYGYPDPTYFQRVKQELASKGVFEI